MKCTIEEQFEMFKYVERILVKKKKDGYLI